MLSYGALERSNNPHIESIVKPFVSQNQKQILVRFLCEFDWEENLEKGLMQSRKASMS